MTTHEAPSTAEPTTAPPPSSGQTKPINRLAKVIGQAARFPGDPYGLGKGEKAALRRMKPEAMRPHQIAALSRAMVQAELDAANWEPETWRRWALIAHGMALSEHNGKGALGGQLFRALGNKDAAQGRVTKLLTARGDAFRQLIPPLLRLLASKDVALNWNELGALILNEGKNEKEAEKIRLRIARYYFSEQEKQAKKIQQESNTRNSS
jgi:CRISPR system Cascade subunit CasB